MVEKILSNSNIGHDELMARIHNKQKELGGFVTMEGAANIVARELGIILEHREPEVRALHIEDLIPGISKVDIVARVARIQEPREFQRSSGTSGWVGSLLLRDTTGQIRLTLWNDQTSLIKDGEVRKGGIIRVQNAYVRQGFDKQAELSLGTRGTTTVNPDDPRAAELPLLEEAAVKISDLRREMTEVDILGRVAVVSDCRVFERPDKTTGKVSTLILTDSTGQVRVSLWDEWAEFSKGLKRGDAVKLENAVVRLGLGGRVELSLDSRGRLVQSPQVAELPEIAERPLRLDEIEADMPTLDTVARVKRKLPPHEFRRDDGSTGKVASVILADETGTIRASFWGGAADRIQELQPKDVVLLRNAYSRVGLGGRVEVHVSGATRLEVNPAGVSIGEPRPSCIKIGELEPNMDALEVVGRAMEIAKPREFTRPDGRHGKVASIIIGDQSGTTRVSLWNEQAGRADEIKVGDVLRLTDCYSTLGLFGQPELHLSGHGHVEINPVVEGLPPVDALEAATPETERLRISEIEKEGIRVQVRGTVVQVFHRRPVFDTCPNCGRSLGSVDTSLFCEECGKVVTPEHRVVLSFLLDDGSDNIRVVLFGKVAEQLLGMDAKQVFELFKSTPDLAEFYNKLNLIGMELVITGTTRQDKYFNQLELRGSEVQVSDPKQEARLMLEKLKEKT
jgi:replication factor A1